MGNEVLIMKFKCFKVLFFAHKMFDILPQWVMKLGLIVCCWLFNLKLYYVIYIYIYIYVCMYVCMYMYMNKVCEIYNFV